MKDRLLRWVGITLAAIGFTGCKSVHAELFVPAPTAEIWAVLMDGERYEEWQTVLVEVVDGELGEGATMTYQMMTSDGSTTEVEATVVKVDPERELNQAGGIPWILTFDHHWILEPVEGGTQVTQHENYAGVGVLFWNPSWFEMAYGRGNEALRDRVARAGR